ncbi:MAG: hypothetical protein R3E66_08685 [bacterium]
MRSLPIIIALGFGLVACGDDVKKGKKTDTLPSNNVASNNANNVSTNNGTPSNNVASNNANNMSMLTCGDGQLDPDEYCDSAIPTGAGSCPNACPPQGACTLGIIQGNAATCSARCEYNVVTSCADDDGCCPEACDYVTDSDCSATCNNGVIDPGETCDGNCPTSCNDNNVCTTDTLTGSAANCSAQCTNVPVTQCVSGDGCCPAGCTSASDNDCQPVCGNGLIEAGERCDGNCPTSCADNNACTADAISGSPAMCNVQCSNTAITACQSGDGCCPSGCTFAIDQDCACQPLTCGAPGRECGSPANGCGGNLNCGTCANGFVCSNFNCVPNNSPLPIGSACTAGSNCAGAIGPFCVANPNFKDGYCSSQCQYDNDCPSGSHCGQKDANGNGSCLKNCTTNADCRAGYACYDQDNGGSGSKECLPSAVGTGTIGSPCTAVYQCAGGTVGACGMASDGFPGGYCTETCTDLFGISTCPTGSTCYSGGLLGGVFGGDLDGYCAKSCTSSAQCRTGYSCKTYTTLLGQTSYQACLPN